MGSKHRLGAGIALAGLLCAGNAAAAVYTVTYAGQIAPGGYDTYGSFGLGSGFTGAAFTLVFTIDTDAPGAGPGDVGPGFHTLQGYGAAPPVHGVFSVGSESFAFGSSFGKDYRYDTSLDPGCAGCTEAGMNQEAYDRVDEFNKNLYRSAYTGASATAYGYGGQFSGIGHGPSASHDAGTGGYFYGSFSLFNGVYDYDTGSWSITDDAAVDLKIASVTVASGSSLSAAPEPATWAMMILGFGLVGAVVRRRNLAGVAASR